MKKSFATKSCNTHSSSSSARPSTIKQSTVGSPRDGAHSSSSSARPSTIKQSTVVCPRDGAHSSRSSVNEPATTSRSSVGSNLVYLNSKPSASIVHHQEKLKTIHRHSKNDESEYSAVCADESSRDDQTGRPRRSFAVKTTSSSSNRTQPAPVTHITKVAKFSLDHIRPSADGKALPRATVDANTASAAFAFAMASASRDGSGVQKATENQLAGKALSPSIIGFKVPPPRVDVIRPAGIQPRVDSGSASYAAAEHNKQVEKVVQRHKETNAKKQEELGAQRRNKADEARIARALKKQNDEVAAARRRHEEAASRKRKASIASPVDDRLHSSHLVQPKRVARSDELDRTGGSHPTGPVAGRIARPASSRLDVPRSNAIQHQRPSAVQGRPSIRKPDASQTGPITTVVVSNLPKPGQKFMALKTTTTTAPPKKEVKRLKSKSAVSSRGGWKVSNKKRTSTSPEASSDSGDDEEEELDDPSSFYVDKVVAKRRNCGMLEYKIRWQGYGPEGDTWEAVANCNCDEAIKDFEAECLRLEKEKLKTKTVIAGKRKANGPSLAKGESSKHTAQRNPAAGSGALSKKPAGESAGQARQPVITPWEIVTPKVLKTIPQSLRARMDAKDWPVRITDSRNPVVGGDDDGCQRYFCEWKDGITSWLPGSICSKFFPKVVVSFVLESLPKQFFRVTF
ncbi:hypothetical protein BV898_06971 [Hypsibius exemplaris]|uniref:Chromo domain-containing protein n=1 Tax=Hypsibius exemplaris TaxID=2072580 RepID=A0A1W0WUL8_HYPEX|nr:hypothetical protein BV898_06971 [Hypsibius exemplaris]